MNEDNQFWALLQAHPVSTIWVVAAAVIEAVVLAVEVLS